MMIHEYETKIPVTFQAMSSKLLIMFYDASKSIVDKRYEPRIKENNYHKGFVNLPNYKKGQLKEDFEFSKMEIQARLNIVSELTLEEKVSKIIDAINDNKEVPELE